MRLIVDNIRLPQQSKDQLSRLKRITGLQRMKDDHIAINRKNANETLRAHIVRGIGSLTAQRQLNGIAELIELGTRK